MFRFAMIALLMAPLPALSASLYTCNGRQSQVCNTSDGRCRVANAPGTSIEVDVGAKRMKYLQSGREWNLVYIETGRGVELFALTEQGSIIVIGAGSGNNHPATFTNVTAPNASIGLITCTKQ